MAMGRRRKLLRLIAFSVPITGATSFAPSYALPSPPLLTRKPTKGAQKSLHHSDRENSTDDDTSATTMDCGEADLDRSRHYKNRRLLLSSFAASALLGLPASPAWAEASRAKAKGAFEYDMEYYVRDLFMGNKPEGNRPASNAPPPHPPRNLQGPLLPLLLDDGLQSCVPIQELAKLTNIPTATLAEQVAAFRSKVQTAFRATRPWNTENIRDEYYFDLTSYALWRTAAAAIPTDYSQRDTFLRNIGKRLLNEIVSREMISKDSIATLDSSNASTLTDTVPCIIEILELFQSTNYCTSYRLGDANDSERTGRRVFDRLDDDELSSGGSVDCLVSVLDPAALGGALQITGEGSRFAPDFVGPTLAAAWERAGGAGAAVRFESYFVDPIYRPNPKDFFPNERFYQFTIARK